MRNDPGALVVVRIGGRQSRSYLKVSQVGTDWRAPYEIRFTAAMIPCPSSRGKESCRSVGRSRSGRRTCIFSEPCYLISVSSEITDVNANTESFMKPILAQALPSPHATIWTYLAYLAISLALTIWVARTLHKNGRVFLVDSFLGNTALADSVNHLLVVGFYLVNIGFVTLALKYGEHAVDVQSGMEILSSKVGLVLVVLGAMHFLNLYVFARLRRRAIHARPVPPVIAKPA